MICTGILNWLSHPIEDVLLINATMHIESVEWNFNNTSEESNELTLATSSFPLNIQIP